MFSKEYWSSSAEKLHSTKYLAIMASMIALKIVVSYWYIPVADNLRILFTFLFVSVESCILGPVAAVVSGMVTDILSFIIHPTGPFFFGYTLSSMAGSLIYALFLYRQKITLWRLAGSKICVNYLVNLLMGSLWSSMMFSKGFYYYFTKSIIKNTVLLPVEIAAMYAVFKIIMPTLEKRHLI